jgi:hypothetical protein
MTHDFSNHDNNDIDGSSIVIPIGLLTQALALPGLCTVVNRVRTGTQLRALLPRSNVCT